MEKSDPKAVKRWTMADIAKRYDSKRQEILDRIAAGKSSASMSGIEYYPKPWSELNINDEGDLHLISTALTWDDQSNSHVRYPLERIPDGELSLNRTLAALFYEPPSEDRNEKVAAIRGEISCLRVTRLMQA